MSTANTSIDGLLVIDKPPNWTSHDIVNRVRRLTGQRHTGHAGTLDPLATGVLPIGLGQGTRVLEYLSDAGKTYVATIRLGVTTDTYDAEGAVLSESSVQGLTREQVASALARFRGTFQQQPPLYSAIKRQGRPLYRYARAGETVEIPTRRVRVDALRLREFEPPDLVVEIDCGSGFYVRSLAHDLGAALGCGGYLSKLRRTRVGPFTESEAIELDRLSVVSTGAGLDGLLWSLDAPLLRRPAVILAERHTADLVQGKRLQFSPQSRGDSVDLCRAYSTAGELIGLISLDQEGWAQPVKVFPEGRRGPNLRHEALD